MIEIIGGAEGGGHFQDFQTKAKLVSSNCHTTRPAHRTPYGAAAATDPGTHVCSRHGASSVSPPPSTRPGRPEGLKYASPTDQNTSILFQCVSGGERYFIH